MLKKVNSSFLKCLVVVSCFVGKSAATQNRDVNGLYLQSKGGFLMAHRSTMAHLVRHNNYSFELGYISHKQSTQIDSSYHYPAMGFNFEFRNFGYNAVLGNAFSLSQFFGVPLCQLGRFFIDFQYGMGLGYLTKKYNLETNPTNNAIGSHINAKVSLKLLSTLYFQRYSIGAGIEISHFSNGAITFPNLGLNVPSLFLQMAFLNTERMKFRKSDQRVTKKSPPHSSILVSSIITTKQVRANPNLPKRYPVLGFRTTFQKMLNGHWSWEGSLDLVHNESNLFFYPDSTFKRSDVLQIGLYAGASYQFYKSEITMGLGYYLRDNINPIGRLYNKIGYRYYVLPKWYGIFNVRANLGKADFFEFGIGYRFKGRL